MRLHDVLLCGALLSCVSTPPEPPLESPLPPCSDPPRASDADVQLFVLALRQRQAAHAPYVIGALTEQAAAAKRLFDSERWAEALPALARVAAGETGDDPGNREIAAYHRAICHYRLNQWSEALGGFGAIALDRSHVKHRESSVWLLKLQERGDVPPAFFVNFDVALVQRFDNPQQQDTFVQAAHLVGRAKLLAGELADAVALFALVQQRSRVSRECHWLAKNNLGRLAELSH